MFRSRLAPVSALVILVLGIYGSRLDKLSIRGEEPRRATVAKEMLGTISACWQWAYSWA